MPKTSIVMLKTHHSRLWQDIRAINRPMCTFPDFNASKLLTKRTLLKSQENDDSIDYANLLTEFDKEEDYDPAELATMFL